MSLLQQSLGVPFPVVLQNTHVIDPASQVRLQIVCAGPNRVAMNASYTRKSNVEYLNDLASLVVNVAHIVPEGMLLVFHSYSHMGAVIKHWSDSGAWGRINREKIIFVEPRNAGELSDVLEQFALASEKQTGGILFCVCRGKITEGIDLADNQCRAVIVAGVPFPAIQDRKVILKREYLDTKNPGDGSKWYMQEAARTVNQTIGRVIRHKNDYGVIILADERFRTYLGGGMFPSWLNEHAKVFTSFGPAVKEISDFFTNLPPHLIRRKVNSGLARHPSIGTTETHLESIHKLISSAPATRAPPLPALPTILPSSNISANAFRILAHRSNTENIPSRVNNSVKSSPSDELSPIEWIKIMKRDLSRGDYLILKRHLKLLLEGAHGQCEVTVSEALGQIHPLLDKCNMKHTFDGVIAGSNVMLRSKWRRLGDLAGNSHN
jgi:hypothetical protein